MNPNPTHKFGDRNYQCRLYEQCDKHVFRKHWTFWTCAECDHKLLGTGVTFVGRKEKKTSAMQYGKFQLLLKKPYGRYWATSETTYVAIAHKKDGTKPHPFQFNSS